MFSKFLKQTGMGLVEVMVAASILGGLSLVVMKLNETGIQGVTRVEKGLESADFDGEVNSYLANQQACYYSFNIGAGINVALFTSPAQLSLTTIKNKNNVTAFTVPQERRLVTLTTAYLTNYSSTLKKADLVKVYTFKLGGGQTARKSKTIPITVTTNTAGTQMTNCIASKGVSDGPWVIDDYGIYYSSGQVAIGKTAATDVVQVLDIEGSIVTGNANTITGLTENYNSIVGGLSSTIGATSTRGGMFATSTNSTISTGINNVMVGGDSNLVSSDYAGMFAARSSGISGTSGTNSIVAGGTANVVSGTAPSADWGYNIIGGGVLNVISAARYSQIIGGYGNTANTTEFATLIGGWVNSMSGTAASRSGILSGFNNRVVGTAPAGDAGHNIIAGGNGNYLATARHSQIFGGESNIVDTTEFSTILGGFSNSTSGTAGQRSAIVAGNVNTILGTAPSGDAGFNIIAGGYGNTISAARYSQILNGYVNTISTSAQWASIIGGSGHTITGTTGAVILGGGYYATAAASRNYINGTGISPMIIGGVNNTVTGNGYNGIIIGGMTNTATASGNHNMVVVGGDTNSVSGHGAGIFAGFVNTNTGWGSGTLAGYQNNLGAEYSVILGGQGNSIPVGGGGTGRNSIVGGQSNSIATGTYYESIVAGYANVIQTSTSNSVVIGGSYNTILTLANQSAVVGGTYNTVSGNFSAAIGGGWNTVSYGGAGRDSYNIVAGGLYNLSSSYYSAVVGGLSNTASTNNYTSVLGGQSNTASGYASASIGGEYNRTIGGWSIAGGYDSQAISGADGSFVFGHHLRANHAGSFVIGDVNATTTTSTVANQFTARYLGGFRMCTNAACTQGLSFTGAAGWGSLSDRNAKEDFREIDGDQILQGILDLDVVSWVYKDQKDKSKRNIGPMAQDFYKIFAKPYELHSSNKILVQNDVTAVTLVGVKTLTKKTQDLKQENKMLKSRIEDLEQEMLALKNAISEISKNNRLKK